MATSEKSRKRFSLSPDELGKPDSFRRNVLQKVSSEQYPAAIESIKAYKGSQPQYPQFKERTERYLDYAVDLVNGIKAKRSFPGIANLPMSKQEELFSRAYDHFEDLKATIRRVEKVEVEVRLEDKRSTVWVVKALLHSAAAIVALGIFLEISHGALGNAENVIDNTLEQVTGVIFKMVGM